MNSWRLPGWVLGLVLVWLPTGCDRAEPLPPAAHAYGEALASVASVAGVDFTLPAAPPREALRYPNARSVSLPIAADSLNLIEFLRLARCDLHRVIASHNSALSRVQDQVEPLFYAAEFIAVAEACLAGGSQSGLMDKLAEARQQKRTALPIYTYNAIFASREVRQFFSPYAELVDFAALESPSVKAAIAELRTLTETLPRAEPNLAFDAARSRFDLALGQLAQRRQAGAVLFYGLWLLELAKTGTALERTLADRSRCDLVRQLQAPGAALAVEFERLRRAAAQVDELVNLAPAQTPLADAYLEPHWQPLAQALRQWQPAAVPERCAGEV